MARPPATLIYAASEFDADLRYASGFVAGDPFLFVQTPEGRKILVVSDLELDRARQAKNARVLPWREFAERATQRGDAGSSWSSGAKHTAAIIREVLRELKLRRVRVPASFPVALADALRQQKVTVSPEPGALYPRRWTKTETEVAAIAKAMRVTERGIRAGLDVLRDAEIKDGWIVHRGKRLTSEALRAVIDGEIFAAGYLPANTIVAGGKQGCDPHERGHGPLRANQPIIIDVFPRSQTSGYFADITRTVVKGKAEPRVRNMFRAVKRAQRNALAALRSGVNGKRIHELVQDTFETQGFPTGEIDGRMQGFFHGTGHGLGLDIHEPPRIGNADVKLKAGMVVTVEPGLYYHPVGGVRIEDTVVITRNGINNLTRLPKTLEIA